jgi:hypothetical protein
MARAEHFLFVLACPMMQRKVDSLVEQLAVVTKLFQMSHSLVYFFHLPVNEALSVFSSLREADPSGRGESCCSARMGDVRGPTNC